MIFVIVLPQTKFGRNDNREDARCVTHPTSKPSRRTKSVKPRCVLAKD